MSIRSFWIPAILLISAVVLAGQESIFIEGRVFDKDTKAPLPAYISLPELDRGVSAGADGRFRIALGAPPAPGPTVRLVAWLIGFKKLEVAARPGQPLSLALELEPLPAREVVVTADSGMTGDAPQAVVTLGRMDIYRLPGAAADPLYASHILPGVNSPPDASSLLIRGGAPDETAFLFDGVEVTHPFLSQSLHEGYFSIFDNQVIEEFNVSTSGFSAAFGDALSGVMDISAKDALFKGEGGLGLSIIGLNSYLGLPLSGSTTFVGSLNVSRSEVMSALNGDHGQSFGTWNGFVKLIARLGRAHTVRLMGLMDRYGFAQDGGFRAGSRNALAAFTLTSTLSAKLVTRLLLAGTSYGAEYNQEDVFDTTIEDRVRQARLEAVLDLDRHYLEAGFDLLARDQSVSWRSEDEGERGVSALRRTAYLNDRFRLLDDLYITAGLRVSSLSLGRPGWKPDPRLSLAYFLTKGDVFRFSAGVTSQFGDHYILKEAGNLKPRSAYHFSLSYDRTTETSSLRVTAYDKEYRDLILQDMSGQPGGNGGRGYARGTELFFKRQARKVDVLVVYNYLTSRRMENEVPALARSPYDITHSLTGILTWKGKRSSVGLRYSYATGRPFTPLLDREWDEAGGEFIPVWDEPYSGRLPAYRRCDLNGSWNFDIGRRMVVLYFGVTNLFNNNNILRYEYSDDYSVRNNTTSIFGRSLFLGLYFPFF